VSPAIEFQFRWLLGGVEGGAVGFGLCKINCIDRLGRKVGCAWSRNDVWSLKSKGIAEKKMEKKRINYDK